jgi:hypothetical protein
VLMTRTTTSAPAASTVTDNMPSVSGCVATTAHDDTVSNSWASQTASLALDPAAFKAPAPSLHCAHKLGSRHPSEKVKAVPRYLACFVGRLAKETTADGLCSYLADTGIKDARCRKLDDKDGLFRSAAFRMSCRDAYKDLFHNESN